jgi:hypothetical protein
MPNQAGKFGHTNDGLLGYDDNFIATLTITISLMLSTVTINSPALLISLLSTCTGIIQPKFTRGLGYVSFFAQFYSDDLPKA